ncbi:hypothetical protein D3C72_610520 [compost metagenome]
MDDRPGVRISKGKIVDLQEAGRRGWDRRHIRTLSRDGRTARRQFAERIKRRFAGRAVVPDGGEFPQRFEKRRRQKQDEEAFG